MGSVFIQLLLEYYHIHFIKNLKPNNFEQTNKSFYFKKIKKNIMFCKDKCGLIMTFKYIYIKLYFVQLVAIYIFSVKLDLHKSKHLMMYNL